MSIKTERIYESDFIKYGNDCNESILPAMTSVMSKSQLNRYQNGNDTPATNISLSSSSAHSFYNNKRKYVAQWHPEIAQTQNTNTKRKMTNNDSNDLLSSFKKYKSTTNGSNRPPSTESMSSLGSTLSTSSSSSSSASSSYQTNNYENSLNKNSTNSIILRIKSSNYSKEECSKLKLKTNYLNKFLANLKCYIQSQPFDLCFILDRNEAINAHKILLLNSTDYFRNKIENEFINFRHHHQENMTYVRLEGVCDLECFKICLDYIYSGGDEFLIPKIKLIDVKNMARLFELDDLVMLADNLIKKYPLINEEYKTYDHNVSSLTTENNDSLLSHVYFNNNNHITNQTSPSQHHNQIHNNHHQQQVLAQNQFDIHNILHQIYLNNFRNDNLFKHQFQREQEQLEPSSQSSENHQQTRDEEEQVEVEQIDKEKDDVLFKNDQVLNKVKTYFLSILENVPKSGSSSTSSVETSLSPTTPVPVLSLTENHLEIDTISRDFFIKDKYIYPSTLINSESLNQFFENFSYINLNPNGDESSLSQSSSSEFTRHSLLIFCLSSCSENLNLKTSSSTTGSPQASSSSNFKFNNYVIKSQLNFTDLNALKEDLKKIIADFLKQILLKLNNNSNMSNGTITNTNSAKTNNFRTILNRVCYLKKPSNCKTIKLETIKTSTDCFRAIVEYSRSNFSNELPYVLVTCHASISFS